MVDFLDSRTEALLLDKADFERYNDTCFDLYPLSPRQVVLIASCLRYAEWDSRWVNRDPDTRLVTDTERVLMSLCLEDLIKSNLRLEAALTGQSVDLDNPEQYLVGVADFSTTGVANRLGPEVAQDDGRTIQATIEAIKNILSETEENDYTDELVAIAQILGLAVI